MIITLYGPDDYRREAKRREIENQFKAKHPTGEVGHFDVSIVEGSEEFVQFLNTQSMFETAKLAVVSGLGEADYKKLPETLKDHLEDKNITILISEDGSLPKKFDFLTKKAASKSKTALISQKFELLKDSEFEKFLADYAKETGITLEVGAIKLIAKVMEGNTWRAATELDKAACLGKKKIAAQDLGDIATELKPDFWGLVNGFKSPDAAMRIKALNSIFASNEPAGKMFNILAYQLPQKTKAIARYDLLVKSGKLDYEEALVDLAIN